MIRLLVLLTILASSLGITTYSAPIGKNLACGGTYNEKQEWVAVPTEWVLGGIVNCGDLVSI